MAELTKQALQVENNTQFPNNNAGLITPTNLRTFNSDMIDSLVDEISYTADSASFNSRINNITGSATNTGSLLLTASFDNGTRNLTFTKGDASTFNVNIPDTSGSAGNFVTTSSFNAYTASTDSSITQLNASSASQQISIDALNTNSASVNISITNVNSATASLFTSVNNINTFTQSAQTSINALNAATSSYVTSAITASSLVTASFSGNTLTFTKGDASTFGVVIPDVSGSTINTGSFVTTSSFNAYTQSNDQRVTSLEANSASVNTSITNINSATSSLFTSASLGLTTASFAGNTLTFTKGDSSTFGVVIPDVSGSGAIPTGTVSSSAQITALGFVSSSVTASSLVTASAAGSTITFTKGDASTFSVSVDTGSAGTTIYDTVRTGENITKGDPLYISGSQGANPIVYKADAADPNKMPVTYVAASTIAINNTTEAIILGHIEGVDLTGYVAGQTIYVAEGGGWSLNLPSGSNSITQLLGVITKGGSGGKGLVLNPGPAQLPGLDTGYMWVGGSTNQPTEITTASFATTGSNNFKGVETIGDIAGTNTGEVYLLGRSGSLVLGNSVNSPTYAALSHLSSSVVNGSTNLIFKNTSFTGDTIISGSGNIFSNPFTATAGYKRYIGGGNNLYLNSTNGINSQITASAISVSGNRPTMNNNIFNGDTDFLINQAVNSVGTHTYSHNKIGGTNATVTINALSHTGSVNILANTVNNAVITINASSASLAEIATGRSGSGTVNVNSNLIQGGTVTNTSPLALGTSLTQTILSNIVTGGSITVTNISSSLNVNAFNNIAIGAISYTNAGAAGLALHRTAGSVSTSYGAMTFIASGSAISATGNISPTAMTVTNRMFSGSLGSGSLTFANNQIQGGGNTYTITGSFGGTGSPAMAANGIFGITNTIFTNVEGRGLYTDFRSNLIGGAGLILTGSNNNAITASGGAYFGRFNADDGRRNGTGENILVVGTGTSATARKTGFLIDSGSNSFFEGTLNVSGSTSFTGSAPTILSSSFSGSLITNLTDIYTDVPSVQQIVTLTSASYAGLVSGSLVDPNTLYVVSGSTTTTIDTSSFVTTSSFNSYTASQDTKNATLGALTGSFATTGSNVFVGNQTITGSLILSSSAAVELQVIGNLVVTGSAIGNVVAMSVTSNTASMDFNIGNYFVLTASVSPIRIEVSNLSGGNTSTLSLLATTGSTITFSSNVQQPSGSAYTASVSGSNDILSFVAFNSSKVNVVSTLKMI
jgi:hypothetical protein